MAVLDQDPLWSRALLGDDAARERVAVDALPHARRRLVAGGVRGQDLDCLSQEAVVKVLISLNRGDQVRHFGAFVKSKARGVLKAWRDRASTTRESTMDEPPEPIATAETPEEGVLSSERGAALRDCLEGLSDALLNVAQMRYWDGLGIGEIAGRLRVNKGTIAVRAFRALEKIRACMESKGFQE